MQVPILPRIAHDSYGADTHYSSLLFLLQAGADPGFCEEGFEFVSAEGARN